MESSGVLKKYTVTVTVFGMLFVFGLVLVFSYMLMPKHAELVKFITAVVGGLAAIYSAFYLAEALRRQVEHSLLQSSFEIVKLTNNMDFVRYRAELEKDFDHASITPAEMYEKITNKQQFDIAVRALLSIFSRAAIAIRQGYADEKTLYMALDTILPSTFQALYPYVQELRKKRKDENIFRSAEMLATSWQQKKYLSTGRRIESIY